MNLDIDQADFASVGQERVTKIFGDTPLTYLAGNADDPVLMPNCTSGTRSGAG